MKKHFLINFIRLIVLVLIINWLPIKIFAEEFEKEIINNQENIKIIASEDADAQNIPTDQNLDSSLAKGEITEERTENTKVFYNGNNSYTKKIYFEPIHLKENGVFKEISADLEPDKQNSDLIETESTKLKANFLSRMENGKYATFEYMNHLLEFSIIEASGNDKNSITVKDTEVIYKTENNQLFYNEIFPQIKLRNFTFNQNSKEDIILNSYEGYHKFKFFIKTDLTAEKSENGSIAFVDVNKKEIFNVPAPIMTDSNYDEHSGEGVSSNDVTYSLEKIDEGYQLIVNADPNWLKDPTRKYPVFIDPTTSISISTDTYVSSATPTTNYEDPSSKWSEALGEYVLSTGYYSSSTGTNHALLKNPISSINGLNISGATLYTYVSHHYYASSTPNGLWLDRNDTDFSPSSVTWNTKPSSTNIDSVNVGINQWAAFNVTSTVKGWADGTIPNYGFKLHTNGNGQTYWKKIVSSANTDYKPYLSVNYTIPKPEVPTAKVIKNADNTGHITLNWKENKGATGYTVWIYNGKEYEAFPVGKVTSWSTKNRKIWPKAAGRYILHHYDKKGTEFLIDPTQVYRNSGGNYPNTTHYWFRISATYQLGESDMSDPVTPNIPNIEVPPPPTGNIYSNVIGGSNGYTELSWDPIVGATGYKLWIFNGKYYESIDIKNNTSWSSKDKGIWPTVSEIENASSDKLMLHLDGKGTDLPKDPSKLYTKMGTGYATSNNFYFRLSAYNANGETIYSPYYFSQSMKSNVKNESQLAPPIVDGFSNDDESATGYLNITWEPLENVSEYQVFLFNGSTYKNWVVPADQAFWTTKNKKLFPFEDQIASGQVDFKHDASGTELPIDPSKLYKKAFELNGGLNYSNSKEYYVQLKVVFNDGTSSISQISSSRIPLDTPKVLNADILMEDESNSEGYAKLDWSPVKNATGYFVNIFNGIDFESIDVGNTTNFSTKDKGIWPTKLEIENGRYQIHKDGLGADLSYEPLELYSNADSNIEELNSYIISVSAYNDKSEFSRPSEEASLPFTITWDNLVVEDSILVDEDIITDETNEDIRLFEPIDLTNIEDSSAEIVMYGPQIEPLFWGIVLRVVIVAGVAAIKYGSKVFKKVPKSTVINALKNFKSKKLNIGDGKTVLLDKSGMTHILERHHPKYWTGAEGKTLFNPKLTMNDISNMIVKIIGQNKKKIIEANKKGLAAEIDTVIDGKNYRLIIKKYKVTTFYPKELN